MRKMAFVSALLLMAVMGCGSGPTLIKPKLQLTFRDVPLKLDPQAGYTVVLIPHENATDTNMYPANYLKRDEATFIIPGRKATGIPPGKYRITIQVMMFERTEEANRINQMFSSDTSAIVHNIQNEDLIVLDLSKPEG